MKIDAVPGQVTTVYAAPNRTGTIGDDDGFRLRCGEMCGLYHSRMKAPVRVVEPEEFEAWVAHTNLSQEVSRGSTRLEAGTAAGTAGVHSPDGPGGG